MNRLLWLALLAGELVAAAPVTLEQGPSRPVCKPIGHKAWASWTSSTSSQWSTSSVSSTLSTTSTTILTTTGYTITASTSITSSATTTPTTTESTAASTSTSSGPSGCSTGISEASEAAVIAAFTSSGVIPDVVGGIDPEVEVNVVYSDKAVTLGNTFLVTETVLAPTLTFTNEEDLDPDTTTYSYFLIDPDVPDPNGAPGVGAKLPFLHWYVSGAKSLCATSQNPQTVVSYQPLTPAMGTHRYTFLVFREPAGYTPDPVAPNTRLGFDYLAYVNSKGLLLVGGNFLRESAVVG